MGKYNFDEVIDRQGTGSSKWDGFEARFPGLDASGALPMWVADMDFRSPDEVIAAIVKKAEQGIYGYPCPKGEKFDTAVKNWISQRHGWKIENEWIVASQGIVPAVTYAVQAFTDEGDGVLIQPPVYYPFKDRCIKFNNRQAVESPLLLKNGRYEIDFNDFEKKAAQSNTKLFILCSPHNPVGRVWTADELKRIIEICERNDVLIFSDEIHSDLIMKGYKHTATGLLEKKGRTISAYSPSKTFNLAGLKTSAIIIPDQKIREKYQQQIKIDEAGGLNIFGEMALTAAYSFGEDYLNELIDYIGGNLDFVRNYIYENLDSVTVGRTEGTYFAWIDFRQTGLSAEEINRKTVEEAKVAGDLGDWFGKEGAGFIRLNLACPRVTVQQAMERLKKVFGKRI